MNRLFVVVLRGWAGVAAWLRALLFDFLPLLYHPELGAIAPAVCGDPGWGWRRRQFAAATRAPMELAALSRGCQQRRWAGMGQGSSVGSVVVSASLLHLKAEGLVET